MFWHVLFAATFRLSRGTTEKWHRYDPVMEKIIAYHYDTGHIGGLRGPVFAGDRGRWSLCIRWSWQSCFADCLSLAKQRKLLAAYCRARRGFFATHDCEVRPH